MGEKYVIGLDYGTLSCRAAMVVCGTGEILADTVQPYKHQVLDQTLPDGKTKLARNWALQHLSLIHIGRTLRSSDQKMEP